MNEQLDRWARRTPASIRAVGRRIGLHRSATRTVDTTAFGAGAPIGPVAEVFHRIRSIPGWFNVDDCAHFSLVLGYQNAMGIDGDLMEIGSYHGRSTAVIAAHLRANQTLVVCDAFEQETDDAYEDRPSPECLMANIRRVSSPAPGQVEVHACYSTALDLPDTPRFRFAHIDGGHGYDIALHDLRLIGPRMVPGGVVVVDDYHHPAWPDVARATDDFLAEAPGFVLAADLNRHGAKGRKAYLVALAD